MSNERKYQDHEIRQILDLAIGQEDGPAPSLPAVDHGNVHAFIEPTETGHRLRLADSNAAVVGIVAGGLVLAFALMIFVVLLGKDDPGFKFAVPAFFSFIGGSLVAGSAISLPRWAREQERRMEHISRHAVSLLALPGSQVD